MGTCRSHQLHFEVAESRDVMRLQEDVEREEAGVKRRSTKNEEGATRCVETERSGDWQKAAEMGRRENKMRAQKRRKRQEFLARKLHAIEARKRRNCDPSTDTEI